MNSLYQISNTYQALLDKEEFNDADMEALDQIADDMREKSIQIAYALNNFRAMIQSIDEAIDRMQYRKAHLFNKTSRLANYLKNELEKCNIQKIDDHPEFEIKIRKNPKKVEVLDESFIPKDFYEKKEVLTLNKKKLKEALESGQSIDGARLIQETSLQIK